MIAAHDDHGKIIRHIGEGLHLIEKQPPVYPDLFGQGEIEPADQIPTLRIDSLNTVTGPR
jgi:hypothetical protein